VERERGKVRPFVMLVTIRSFIIKEGKGLKSHSSQSTKLGSSHLPNQQSIVIVIVHGGNINQGQGT
jgi:hypothetical protein